MILILFIQFLLIGMVAFGGGTAMIPLLQRVIVIDQSWLTLNEFIDVIGLSQMTPGPIAINAATFIGFNSAFLEYESLAYGFIGATVATLGVLTFPIIFMSVIIFFEHNETLKKVINRLIYWITPALVGLILASALTLIEASGFKVMNLVWIIIAMILFFKTKVHPFIWILVSGVLGVIIL